jgi:hypothetical protein
MPDWAADYKTMQEQMIHGESPSFERLIDSLKILNERINTLPWKMNCTFPPIPNP